MLEYKNVKINYKDFGNKDGDAILYLHGWGQNIAMMEPIAKPLEDTHHIVIIDLPGFGESSEPEYAWSLDDFVLMVNYIITKLKLKNVSLIGHSFGGKISLLYASKYDVKKLVLLASPYKVKMAKPSLKVRILKKFKNVPGLKGLAEKMKKRLGSTDYRNASPIMRDILVKHVNTSLIEDAKKIKCPTLIVWGTNDTEVPINDAYELEKLIPDSGVVVYEGCTHYAYIERLNQTISVLKSFMK